MITPKPVKEYSQVRQKKYEGQRVYETGFSKTEFDRKLDRNNLPKFLRDCGYSISNVFQLVCPASTAAVRSIKQHQAIEMAFTLFPPLGAKVKNLIIVLLPGVHPLMDGKVRYKKLDRECTAIICYYRQTFGYGYHWFLRSSTCCSVYVRNHIKDRTLVCLYPSQLQPTAGVKIEFGTLLFKLQGRMVGYGPWDREAAATDGGQADREENPGTRWLKYQPRFFPTYPANTFVNATNMRYWCSGNYHIDRAVYIAPCLSGRM